METDMSVEIGAVYGRWTVVRRVHAVPRRASGYARARCEVRCACGRVQTVFVEDLEDRSTTGCGSRTCLTRFKMAQDLRTEVDRMLSAYLLRAGTEDRETPPKGDPAKSS
jgi:hypothetical protein